MDHDIIGTHVQRLLEFKKRVEDMIESWEAPAAPASDGRVDDLVKDVAGVKAWMDGVTPHLDALNKAFEDAKPTIDEMPGLLEGLSGLKDMAEWFAVNRDGLEAVLSLGDDLTAKPATIDSKVISSTTAPQAEPAPAPPPAPAAEADQAKPVPDATITT